MTPSLITVDALYNKLSHIKVGTDTCLYTLERCEAILPLIHRIETLKQEKDAVILAHSYVSPDILCVADFVGDSYELSKKAQAVTAGTIIFTAVKFMAETAQILNPTKQVFIPNKLNGCSLADSITAEQVRQLRVQYPEYTFVCYINTSAEVKAECDVCVTSSNVTRIIESIPNDLIYFLPDKLMAKNVQNELKQKGSPKTLLWWEGACYVHETYDPDMIAYMRLQHPGLKVVSHPECDEAVVEVSDYVGSTSQMINYVNNTQADSFFLLTECGLSSRLQLESPQKAFVGACTMCKYMKSNTLADIVRVLENPDPEDKITLSQEVAIKAQRCIDAMFVYAG